jgi:hypothetical protein
MKLTDKEYGTIIFALEEYQSILDKEGDVATRNYVIDLIHKVDNNKGESNENI